MSRLVADAGLEPEVRHLANSAGALWLEDARHDLVRLGIAAYGLSPEPGVATSDELGLVTAMTVRGRLVMVKQLAEGEGGGKFSAPKNADVGADKLKAATCSAQVTASSGQGSTELLLVSVVSVRSTDGVAVVGTVAFTEASDQDALQKDFSSMSNSMLETQAAG